MAHKRKPLIKVNVIFKKRMFGDYISVASYFLWQEKVSVCNGFCNGFVWTVMDSYGL